jgi:UDP:flavonoid glycosyltransferase YjiC (YdhE family)
MISTRRGAGHFGPLIPFAKAFLRNNDEVVVTAPQGAAPMITAAELDHLSYPDPPDEERDAIIRRARQLSHDDGNELVLTQMFIRVDTTHAYPHLLAAMRSWRPDAVLYDVSEFAAPLAAEALGIPAVCVGITVSGEVDLFYGAPMAAELDKVRARFGLRPDPELEMLTGAPHFTLTPDELEGPGDGAIAQAMRFREDGDPPRPLPDWWSGSQWPLVYLTFGSVAPTMEYFPGLYRDALDALALLPVRVLVTVGRERDPRELGPVGPNVHVARWVPQADVMPHAAVTVCHGGSGTVRMGRYVDLAFMGAAFLLLETKSIVSFSLLFGTTWLVNALTFFAILASVLLAILVSRRVKLSNPVPLYAALFLAIAVAYLLPPESLLIDPPALRYAVASAVAFAPVFFANLVFTYSFRDTATADMSFASNLLGAMVGGALEYLALLTGFRALLLVVAVLYALAFVLARYWRLLADVDLVAAPASVPETG